MLQATLPRQTSSNTYRATPRVRHAQSRLAISEAFCTPYLLVHGRRPRTVSFVLNDCEPAIHARILILVQLFLDSRSLLKLDSAADVDGITPGAAAVDGITPGVAAVDVQGGEREVETPPPKKAPTQGKLEASGVAFAQRIGVVFR